MSFLQGVYKNSGHALWNCVAAQDAWSAGCVRIQKMSYQSNDFAEIWREFFQKLEELEVVVVISKLIRMRRNAFFHERDKANEGMSLFQSTQAEAHSEISLTAQRCVWLKLPSYLYKVNWDAAINESRGKVGIGVIIRDSMVQFIGSYRDSRVCYVDSRVAESIPVRVAITFCKDRGSETLYLKGI